MITANEVSEWAGRLGVAEQQVRHDHLVSHLIAGLEGIEDLVFFGGTALSRTYLEDRRLSEDIDLYLDPHQPPDQGEVLAQLQQATQREFPGLDTERLRRVSDVTTYAVSYEGLAVVIDVVGARPEHRAYEVAGKAVTLRYSDLPSAARLLVPTIASFGAMKLGAYEDRHAARDLFDLDALVAIAGVTPTSLTILKRARGFGPVKHQYEDRYRPTDIEWRTQLDHQTGELGDPQEALDAVRSALIQLGAL